MNHDRPDVAQSQGRFTYAKIPLVMRKDPLLTLADIAVTMYVLPWIGTDGSGWTSVATIAQGAELTERAVQKSLRRLEAAGWFSRVAAEDNATGRRFVANWTTYEGFLMLADRLGVLEGSPHHPALTYVVTRVVGPEPAGVGRGANGGTPKGEECKRGIELSPDAVGGLARETSHDVESPCETTLTAGGHRGARTADEVLVGKLHRGVAGLYRSTLRRGILRGPVRSNARIIAELLLDDHSFEFHCGLLWRVVDGDIAPATYMEAFDITCARAADEGVDNPGSYFTRTLRNLLNRRTEAEFAEEWDSQHGAG